MTATSDLERDTEHPAPTGPLAVVWPVIVGACMGTADAVPGVSGGTVALVMGVYERLLSNIAQASRAVRAILTSPRRGLAELAKVEFSFLARLFLGIGTVLLLLAGPLEAGIEEHPIEFSALFFGLIVAASILAYRLIERPSRETTVILVVSTVATAAVFGIATPQVTDPGLLVFFVAGAVAACAMILPGISGSFLLLAIGMLPAVYSAVDDRNIVQIAALGTGAATGLALFSTVLDRALDRWHDPILAGLVGLMVGSLRILWPWPTGEAGLADTRLGAPGADVAVAVALMIGAAAVVLVLDWLARRMHAD